MWNPVQTLVSNTRSPTAQRLWERLYNQLGLDPPAFINEDMNELRERMQKPQRHRLLHGYPLAAAMPCRPTSDEQEDIHFNCWNRGLLVGVLPHPFCNPAVAGCGFCTFPHQKYESHRAAELVNCVAEEIDQRLRFQSVLPGRSVEGLYFGGGTANLAPAEPFTRLCRQLSGTFRLDNAEITLEGVPAYFIKRRPLLMDVVQQHLPARHYRISMGIQTFDEDQLRRMGRLAFGTEETFREVVREAHARGFTASSDLLFNLPGQSLPQMRDDLRRAVDLGLDHLGLYHLVLFRGLGTEWSRDESMLAGLPCNEEAAENWLALREWLLANGFYQTTLTNFERNEYRGQPPRFVYEEKSFQPEQNDMIGFGPTGISFAADSSFAHGLKILNPESAEDYRTAVHRGTGPWNRFFYYRPRDLRVFYLTRRLAALEIDRATYRKLFRRDPLDDFAGEFRALQSEKLVEISETSICPTPRGMFYADSIAALLAWRRIQTLRKAKQLSSGERLQSLIWSKSRQEQLRQERLHREQLSQQASIDSNAYGHM